MTWATDDGWENGAWCIVTCKPGLAHAGTVVNHKSGDLLF
jgi:hypothetical protein